MMKIYKVKVNGKVYEVELESVSESTSKIEVNKTEVEKPSSNEGASLLSPIQGTVLKLNVSEGDKVSKGDTLMVIEAMKLENEIVAPRDGIIKGIKVNKGQSVNSKDVLLMII